MFRIAFLHTQHLNCQILTAGNEHEVLLFLHDVNAVRIVREEERRTQAATNGILVVIGQLSEELGDLLVLPTLLNGLVLTQHLVEDGLDQAQELVDDLLIRYVSVCQDRVAEEAYIFRNDLFLRLLVHYLANDFVLTLVDRLHNGLVDRMVDIGIDHLLDVCTFRRLSLVVLRLDELGVEFAEDIILDPTVTVTDLSQLRQINGRHIHLGCTHSGCQLVVLLSGCTCHLGCFILEEGNLLSQTRQLIVLLVLAEVLQQVAFPAQQRHIDRCIGILVQLSDIFLDVFLVVLPYFLYDVHFLRSLEQLLEVIVEGLVDSALLYAVFLLLDELLRHLLADHIYQVMRISQTMLADPTLCLLPCTLDDHTLVTLAVLQRLDFFLNGIDGRFDHLLDVVQIQFGIQLLFRSHSRIFQQLTQGVDSRRISNLKGDRVTRTRVHLTEQLRRQIVDLTLLYLALFAFRAEQPATENITTQTETHVLIEELIRLL